MKKTFTRFLTALMLLAFFIPSFIAMGQTKITDYTNIVSGTRYYIGATTSGTDYYLSVNGSSLTNSIAGTAVTSQSSATPFTLAGSGTTWTIQFDNGYYLSLKTSKDNGKVQVVENSANFTASNQSSKIRMQISGANFSIQKNNSGTQFGSYGNTQTDIWLMEVPSSTTTYTVTYHANVTGVSDIEEEYNEGATVTIADNTFSNPGYAFTEWNTEEDGSGDSYAPGDVINDIDDDLELYAQWEVSTSTTGTIKFGSSTGHVKINAASVSGDDDINNEWTITTVGTTSFTQQATYSQVGSSSSPATSITFTTTLAEEVEVTAMEVKFGGFNGTEGTITMKVGNTTIGTGLLNAGTDVVVNSNSTATGDVLTVTITNISKGVKCYYISYTYEEATPDPAIATTTTITVPSGFNTDIHNGTSAGTLTASVTAEGSAVSGATVTWSSSDTGVATIAANGTVTLVAVGTTTITASYAGVTDQYRPSSDTYELTVIDSYAPGTENNPYTVAQARAAIDANTGITNVYATGIISQVDSYSNNTITYWISDDGTTTNQLEVYKGKNLNNTNFTALSDVEVGATVIVFGTLKKYNEIYEFNSGNYLTSYTAPQHDVETPTFSPVAGTYAEAQTVTLSCATATATIFYTIDGTDPATSNTTQNYTNPITVSSTTTIKAVAVMGQYTSNMATATYHINSQANPYTVAQALAFNEYPANGIYVHGKVSTAASSISSGTLTYYISDDGTTTNQLEVYKGKDLNNENFTAADDIQVGDIVTIYGNVVIYGTTNPIKEFASGNYLVSFERPAVPYDLTVSTLASNVNGIYVFDANDQSDPLIANGAAGTVQVTSGTSIMVSPDIASGYVLASLTVDGNDVTSQVTGGEYTFTMPTHAVTVTATASLAPVVTTNTYTLATSIESGKQYIIVGQADGNYYAMGYQKSNNRHAVEISVTGNTATATIANTETNAHEFTISTITEGYYSIMDATTSGGYLYAASSGSNYLKTENELDENNNGKWTITFSTEGYVGVVAQGNNTRNVMQFNTSGLFNCYASASQHPVYLYQKDEEETYNFDIAGYGTNEGGYYLISSPVSNSFKPSATLGFIDATPANYDLYYFDEARELEWINFKQAQDNFDPNFDIVSGKGYLYAHKTGTTLSFQGTPYNGNGQVTLKKTAGAQFSGWNLVGNPFTQIAYIDRDFYVMNYEMDGGVNYGGSEIILANRGNNNPINMMEGIFVVASTDNETLTFSTTAPAGKAADSKVVLNIVGNNGNVIDRAIVRFGEGGTLPKFMINENNTKIYFPQEDADYAVVRSNGEGSMPVNFKAKEMGKYTVSVETEDIDINYLHLIDRLTGADVNLLLDNEYSFIASGSDIESRFILSFNENGYNAASDETFAFQNGNDIVVNGEGELQVFDVTGRMVMNTVVNGIQTVNVPANGVYVFRMIGETVKTQKIVVK